MKTKMFLCIILLASLAGLTSCTKEETAPEPQCNGIITPHMHISAHQDEYAIDFDVTNLGDRRINSVNLPFVITFLDGSSDQRAAYNPIVNVLPGETLNDIGALINPPNQVPQNPRWINLTGKIASVKYLTPEIICAQ
jgi:hypothetical protein